MGGGIELSFNVIYLLIIYHITTLRTEWIGIHYVGN